MCTVAQRLPEQLLTSETPGPATELCRRRYRKGGPATQLVHAQGWHPNGGFPDCFTFQAAALLRLLCLPCVSPPSTAVAPHKRCHHDTELHLRLTTTTTTTLQSILRPIRPFDFASPYPSRNTLDYILGQHQKSSAGSFSHSARSEQPMLLGKYIAGLVILSVLPLLFLLARCCAKRSRLLPWSIDDTLLVLALVLPGPHSECEIEA